MNFIPEEDLLGEAEYPEGVVVVVIANPDALQGQPGPEVFATLDHDRHVVAWSRRYIGKMLDRAKTDGDKFFFLGQVIHRSYEAVLAHLKE